MSKYTEEQLQAKATASLRYKQECPNDYMMLVMYTSYFSGIPPEEVERRIEMMSKGDFSYE